MCTISLLNCVQNKMKFEKIIVFILAVLSHICYILFYICYILFIFVIFYLIFAIFYFIILACNIAVIYFHSIKDIKEYIFIALSLLQYTQNHCYSNYLRNLDSILNFALFLRFKHFLGIAAEV